LKYSQAQCKMWLFPYVMHWTNNILEHFYIGIFSHDEQGWVPVPCFAITFFICLVTFSLWYPLHLPGQHFLWHITFLLDRFQWYMPLSPHRSPFLTPWTLFSLSFLRSCSVHIGHLCMEPLLNSFLSSSSSSSSIFYFVGERLLFQLIRAKLDSQHSFFIWRKRAMNITDEKLVAGQ